MSLHLTFACGDYDRTRALLDGRVTPEGVTLDYQVLRSSDIHHRQTRFQEWDASELSFGTYLIIQSRDNNPFVAIPVFPSRYFRHGFIWVNANARIERPEQLKGKRIGVPNYHMTAAIWMRGFLEDDYGVRPEDCTWFVGGLNEPKQRSRLELSPIPSVRIETVKDTECLNDMLRNGSIDALMAGSFPKAFVEGDPQVKRLFQDHVRIEKQYFATRHLFPIMHCVVIRREIYEQHPWIAMSLYRAFVSAKQMCMAKLAGKGPLPVSLPWLLDYFEEVRETLGSNFWPYGVERNRYDLEALLRYMNDQHLLERELSIEELFPPEMQAVSDD